MQGINKTESVKTERPTAGFAFCLYENGERVETKVNLTTVIFVGLSFWALFDCE